MIGPRRGALVVLVCAALAPGRAVALASPADVPRAECHDLALRFAAVTYQSYDVVAQAVVTRPGVFALGPGHAYFGSSDTPADPAGVVMTATDHVLTGAAGTDVVWSASCVGARTTATVHVPAAPRPRQPPRVVLSGPAAVAATSHRGAADPLRAHAFDSQGARLPVHCTPAVLPLVPHRTTVTCTAVDSTGLAGSATREVTVLGAGPQLASLARSLPAGRLRDLVVSAGRAVDRRDGPAAARRLGLVLDALPSPSVHAAVVQVAAVLGVTVPHLHVVRPGETVWGIVRLALVRPSEQDVAAGVRLVLARNPAARHLQPGQVLLLPF